MVAAEAFHVDELKHHLHGIPDIANLQPNKNSSVLVFFKTAGVGPAVLTFHFISKIVILLYDYAIWLLKCMTTLKTP